MSAKGWNVKQTHKYQSYSKFQIFHDIINSLEVSGFQDAFQHLHQLWHLHQQQHDSPPMITSFRVLVLCQLSSCCKIILLGTEFGRSDSLGDFSKRFSSDFAYVSIEVPIDKNKIPIKLFEKMFQYGWISQKNPYATRYLLILSSSNKGLNF